MNVISPETRMMGLPYAKEIMIVGRTMWTQCTSVTDRQTDGRTELRSQRPCNAERRTVKQESCAVAKMTARCPEFSGLPNYAHGYYSQHFSWSFVPIDPMNHPTKFEVRSFTRSCDNKGYPKKLGNPWMRPRSLYSKIFNGLLFGLAL